MRLTRKMAATRKRMARMPSIHFRVRLIIRDFFAFDAGAVNLKFHSGATRSIRFGPGLCDGEARKIAMRLIWKSSPSPRLLNTVVPDVVAKKADIPTGKFALKGASLFSGNGRAIFVGLVLGAVIFSILGITYTRHQSQKRQREAGARAAALARPNPPPTESPLPAVSIPT